MKNIQRLCTAAAEIYYVTLEKVCGILFLCYYTEGQVLNDIVCVTFANETTLRRITINVFIYYQASNSSLFVVSFVRKIKLNSFCHMCYELMNEHVYKNVIGNREKNIFMHKLNVC